MYKICVFLFFVLFSIQEVFSSGFQLNDHSGRSVGMSFSTVANIFDPSAIYYNPAAMTTTPSTLSISAGTAYIMPGSKFTGITDLNQQITESVETWNFVIPHFYAVWKTPLDGLTFGAGVFVPFGLGTQWPDDWYGRHSALKTYLEAIEINPNLAYRFKVADIPVSIAAGFGFVLGNVELQKKLDLFNPEPLLKLKGDGNGTTFNFAIHLEPIQNMKIGASYRHNIEIEFEGDVEYENISGVEPLFQGGKGGTKINFPNNLKFGIAYQILDGFWLEAGIDYTGWSSYDSLVINFDKGPGNPSAPYSSRQERAYKNVIAYRLAGEYQINNDWTARLGLGYDPIPVDPDFVEPVLPEGNRIICSAGLGYKITRNFSVDLGYCAIIGQQTEVENNVNNINGLYNMWANILCLTINYNY